MLRAGPARLSSLFGLDISSALQQKMRAIQHCDGVISFKNSFFSVGSVFFVKESLQLEKSGFTEKLEQENQLKWGDE